MRHCNKKGSADLRIKKEGLILPSTVGNLAVELWMTNVEMKKSTS
jgi:hypothetical protein